MQLSYVGSGLQPTHLPDPHKPWPPEGRLSENGQLAAVAPYQRTDNMGNTLLWHGGQHCRQTQPQLDAPATSSSSLEVRYTKLLPVVMPGGKLAAISGRSTARLSM